MQLLRIHICANSWRLRLVNRCHCVIFAKQSLLPISDKLSTHFAGNFQLLSSPGHKRDFFSIFAMSSITFCKGKRSSKSYLQRKVAPSLSSTSCSLDAETCIQLSNYHIEYWWLGVTYLTAFPARHISRSRISCISFSYFSR